eukprot:2530690-Rhodomonas_salina.1
MKLSGFASLSACHRLYCLGGSAATRARAVHTALANVIGASGDATPAATTTSLPLSLGFGAGVVGGGF